MFLRNAVNNFRYENVSVCWYSTLHFRSLTRVACILRGQLSPTYPLMPQTSNDRWYGSKPKNSQHWSVRAHFFPYPYKRRHLLTSIICFKSIGLEFILLWEYFDWRASRKPDSWAVCVWRTRQVSNNPGALVTAGNSVLPTVPISICSVCGRMTQCQS